MGASSTKSVQWSRTLDPHMSLTESSEHSAVCLQNEDPAWRYGTGSDLGGTGEQVRAASCIQVVLLLLLLLLLLKDLCRLSRRFIPICLVVLPFRQFTCRWQGSHLLKTSNIETYVCKYMELYYALSL